MNESSVTAGNSMMNQQRNSVWGERMRELGNSFKSKDLFSERFRMKLDDGEGSVSTYSGALCSIFIVTLVLLYSYLKTDVLVNRKDVDVLSTIKDFEFEDTEIFSHDNGFNIAVGFTAYDTSSDWLLDSTYGELVFASYSWGMNPDGTYYEERKEVP